MKKPEDVMTEKEQIMDEYPTVSARQHREAQIVALLQGIGVGALIGGGAVALVWGVILARLGI